MPENWRCAWHCLKHSGRSRLLLPHRDTLLPTAVLQCCACCTLCICWVCICLRAGCLIRLHASGKWHKLHVTPSDRAKLKQTMQVLCKQPWCRVNYLSLMMNMVLLSRQYTGRLRNLMQFHAQIYTDCSFDLRSANPRKCDGQSVINAHFERWRLCRNSGHRVSGSEIRRNILAICNGLNCPRPILHKDTKSVQMIKKIKPPGKALHARDVSVI